MTTESIQSDLPKLSQSKSTPTAISTQLQITKTPSNGSVHSVNDNLKSFPLNIVLTTSNKTKIRVELTEIFETALSIKDDMNTTPKKVSFFNEEDDDEHKNYKIGDLVITSKNKQGLIRYIGELHYDTAIWFGIELIGGHRGYHDGQFQGQRYFTCSSNQGIFVKKHQIIRRMNDCDFDNDNKSKRTNTAKQKKKIEKKLGPRDIGKIKGWKPSREIYKTEQELKAEETRSGYKRQQKKRGVTTKRSSLTEIELELMRGGSLFKSTTTKQVEKKPGPRDIGRIKSKETDWRPIQNADKIIEKEKKKGFLDPSIFKSNTQRRHRAASSALLVRKAGPPKVIKTKNKKRGSNKLNKTTTDTNTNTNNNNKLSLNKLSIIPIDCDETRINNKYKSKTPTPSTNGLRYNNSDSNAINVTHFEYSKKAKRSKRRKEKRSNKKKKSKHYKRDRSDSENVTSPTSPTRDNIVVTPIDTTKRTRSKSRNQKRKSAQLKKPKKKRINNNNNNERKGGRIRSRTVTTRTTTNCTEEEQEKHKNKHSKHDVSKSMKSVRNICDNNNNNDGIPGFPKRSKSMENRIDNGSTDELILHCLNNNDNDNNNQIHNAFPEILNFSKQTTDESQTSDDLLYRHNHGNTLSLHSTSNFLEGRYNKHQQSHSANYEIQHERNKTDGSVISDTSVTIRVSHTDNHRNGKKKKNNTNHHRKKKSKTLNMSKTATIAMFDNDALASSSDGDGDGDGDDDDDNDNDAKIDDNDTLFTDINAEIEERKSGLQDIEKQLNELATSSAEFDMEFKKHLEEAQMNQNQFKQNHNQIIQEIESDFDEAIHPKNNKNKIKQMLWIDDDDDDDDDDQHDDDDDVLNIIHSNYNVAPYIE